MASHATSRKCFGLASMPAFPQWINRRCPCRCTACASTPPRAAGRLLCRFARLAPELPNGRPREKLLEAARRREIDVVLVWRLDRWGRSVTGSAGHAPGTGASWRRLRVADRGAGSDDASRSGDGRSASHLRGVRTGDSARTNSRRSGSCTAERETVGSPCNGCRTIAAEIRKLHRAGVSKAEIARRLQIGRTSVRRILRAQPDEETDARTRFAKTAFKNEAIVDARPEEQAMGWYYYLENKISFPFQARCIAVEGRLAAPER